MKNINEQDIRDIELTEDELDQVQGGVAVAPVLVGVAIATALKWTLKKARFIWLLK